MILNKLYAYLKNDEYKITFNKNENYDNLIIFNDAELLDINIENNVFEYFYVDKTTLRPKGTAEFFGILSVFISLSVSLFYTNSILNEKSSPVLVSNQNLLHTIAMHGFSEYNTTDYQSKNKIIVRHTNGSLP